MLVFVFLVGSLIGFLVKLPSGFRHIDKELHTAFYFFAAAFLNILFTHKKWGRHILIFILLAIFGIAIEYPQDYSNRFFDVRIHGRFDTEDVQANLKGLVAFSVVWFIYLITTVFTKKNETKRSDMEQDLLSSETNQPAVNTGIEIITRPATEEEIDTLLEFERGIVLAERPFDKTLKEGEIHYYDLLELIRSPNSEVMVAVTGDELIGSGYATINTAKPYLKHSRYAYLGFMYTKPEYRGKGVNQLILNALINWAKNKGITEIRLEVYNENTAAIRAYEKSGFTPNLLEMRRSI